MMHPRWTPATLRQLNSKMKVTSAPLGHRITKIVILLLILTHQPSLRGQDREVRDKLHEAMAVAADAITADTPVILVGQVRRDGYLRKSEQGIPETFPFQETLTSLYLVPVFVSEVIRSDREIPPVIYVQDQITSRELPRVRGQRFRGDLFADDSMKVFFLHPATKPVSKPLEIGGSAISEAISKHVSEGVSADELFNRIGVSQWITRQTWFVPHAGRATIRIDTPPSELREIPRFDDAQMGHRSLAQHLKLPVLPAGFINDLRRILKHRSASIPRARQENGSSLRETHEGSQLAEMLLLRQGSLGVRR